MAALYIYFILGLLCSYAVSASEEAVLKGQKRFLFDFVYDCKHCYQCACRFQRCPNFIAWEYAGAYTQCAFTMHNLNCQANFHQDGGWTVWSQWSECQGYCSAPTRKRTRACTNPRPYNCGQKCNGADTEYDHTCIPQYCTSANSSMLLGTTLSSNASSIVTSTPGLPTLSTSSSQGSQSISGSASLPTTVQTNTHTASTNSGSSRSSSAMVPQTNPAMVTQTNPAMTTQSTLSMATQTQPAPLLEDFGSCDTYCTLNSLLTKTKATDNRASVCPDGSHGGGDALLIKCCNVTASSQWTRGKKIDGNCDSVPRYSPVASFIFGNSVRGTSGIFVGCSLDAKTGFQMIRQECNDTSQVVSVSPEQRRFPAPDTYYVVESLSN